MSLAAGLLQLAACGALALAAAALRGARELATVRWLLAVMTLADAAALAGLWPYLVPPSLSIWQMASPTGNETQLVVTLGAIVLILGYLSYSYYVFKGKVDADYPAKRQRHQAALARQLTPGPAQPEARQVTLPLAVRLLLGLVGTGFFFLVIGTMGEVPALVALVAGLAAFVWAWLRFDHPDTETPDVP